MAIRKNPHPVLRTAGHAIVGSTVVGGAYEGARAGHTLSKRAGSKTGTAGAVVGGVAGLSPGLGTAAGAYHGYQTAQRYNHRPYGVSGSPNRGARAQSRPRRHH